MKHCGWMVALFLVVMTLNAGAESPGIESKIVHDDTPDCLVVTLGDPTVDLENGCDNTVTVAPVKDECVNCSQSVEIKPTESAKIEQGGHGLTNKYSWRIEATSQEGSIEVEWHYLNSNDDDDHDHGDCSAGVGPGNGWLPLVLIVLSIGFLRRRKTVGQEC